MDFRFVTEAYEVIKPHLKYVKNAINEKNTGIKQSKEILIHFFAETEKCKKKFYNI
jgi:hypothetical protein